MLSVVTYKLVLILVHVRFVVSGATCKLTESRQCRGIVFKTVFSPPPSQFDEIPEVLARYSTLRTTLDGLMEHEQHNQDAIDEEKADLVKFTEVHTRIRAHACTHTHTLTHSSVLVLQEKNNEMLSQNNQVSCRY